MGAAREQTGEEWMVNFRGQVKGPYDRGHLIRLILSKRIDKHTQVMKVGDQIWRLVGDCLHEIANDATARKSRAPRTGERRVGAPRIDADGVVTFYAQSGDDHSEAVTGRTTNLSVSGIFVSTDATAFKIGDEVELEIALSGSSSRFRARARIMRHNAASAWAVGYGLQFIEISNEAVEAIQEMVGFRPIQEFRQDLGDEE